MRYLRPTGKEKRRLQVVVGDEFVRLTDPYSVAEEAVNFNEQRSVPTISIHIPLGNDHRDALHDDKAYYRES